MLLIHDSVEVTYAKTVNGSDLERQLEHINASISALDERVNRQLIVSEDMARTIGLEWDDNAVLDEEIVEPMDPMKDESMVGPEDAKLGAEISVFPAFGQDQREGDRDRGSQYPESVLGNAKVHVAGKASGDDSKGDEQLGPAADGDTPQLSLRDRLTALEVNVKSMNQTLRGIAQSDHPGMLGRKLDALETKMDRQFGTLLALMQNSTAVAGASRPLTSSSRYYPVYHN